MDKLRLMMWGPLSSVRIELRYAVNRISTVCSDRVPLAAITCDYKFIDKTSLKVISREVEVNNITSGPLVKKLCKMNCGFNFEIEIKVQKIKAGLILWK